MGALRPLYSRGVPFHISCIHYTSYGCHTMSHCYMLWNTSHNLFVLFFLSTELLLTLLFLLVSHNQLTSILFTHVLLYLVYMGLGWWFRPPPAGHRFKRSSRLSTATQLSSWHEGYLAVCATGHKLKNTKFYYCEMIGKRMFTWMNPFLVSNITTILVFHSNNYN